jgi:hypothetical protein
MHHQTDLKAVLYYQKVECLWVVTSQQRPSLQFRFSERVPHQVKCSGGSTLTLFKLAGLAFRPLVCLEDVMSTITLTSGSLQPLNCLGREQPRPQQDADCIYQDMLLDH